MNNLKDHEAPGAPPKMPPDASAATQKSCHEDSTVSPRKLPSRSLQLTESVASPLRTPSKGTVRRVLGRLRDGQSERWVARKEEITVEQVCEIRKAYFSLIPRAFAVFRMEHENAQDLFSELEADVLEQECA